MLKILFVCTNDFVRAPLAAGILRQIVAKANRSDDFLIASAGTFAGSVPRAPDRRAIDIAAENGIDISAFRSREFQPSHLEEFDRLIILDEDSYSHVRDVASAKLQSKIWLFREVFGDLSIKEIPDPTLGEESFQKVFQMLERGVRTLALRLLRG